MLFAGSIILLVVVITAAFSIIVRTLRNGVPPMPSSGRVQAAMLEMVHRLRLSENATIVELGSGWGTLSLALCRLMPKAAVIGYENSTIPLLVSRVARRLRRIDNLRLLRADFYAASLREADLVVCYLSPDAMARLRPKFEAELGPSAFVVSSTFALPAWKASRVMVANDVYRTPIYGYAAGEWRNHTVGRFIDILEAAPDSDTDDHR